MTNKIVLPTADEFISGFKPTYVPLLPLFMSKAKIYSIEEGTLNFKRVDAVGDLRSKIFGSKDTEIHQITAKDSKKSYKKYFFASQFVQSNLQSTEGYSDVVAQVLNEHNKQADELFLTGEGTANNNVVNNGLFYSGDANFLEKASYEVKKDTNGDHLADLYQKMVSITEEANVVDGQKMILVYGSAMIAKYNSLFVETKNPFSEVLGKGLPGVAINKIPASVTPAGNGFIVINMDQIMLHITTLPIVKKNGINEEKEYAWTNFLLGSTMLEVLAASGVIKQPVTFEA